MRLLRFGVWLQMGLLLPSSGTAIADPGDSWRIAGNAVNLRRAPTTTGEIKRQLNEGTQVVERNRQGDWYEVELSTQKDLIGWVHRSLLTARRKVKLAARPKATEQPIQAIRPAIRQTNIPEPSPTFVAPDEDVVIEEMLSYVKRRKQLPKEPVKPRVGQSGREIISPVPIRKPGDQSRVPTELVLASSDILDIGDPEAMETFRNSVSYLNSRAWSVAGIKLFSEIEPVGGGVVQVKTTDEWFEVPAIGQTSYLNTLLDRWSSAKADGGPAGIMLVDAKGDLLMHQTKP